jgi:hypothetical protein
MQILKFSVGQISYGKSDFFKLISDVMGIMRWIGQLRNVLVCPAPNYERDSGTGEVMWLGLRRSLRAAGLG